MLRVVIVMSAPISTVLTLFRIAKSSIFVFQVKSAAKIPLAAVIIISNAAIAGFESFNLLILSEFNLLNRKNMCFSSKFIPIPLKYRKNSLFTLENSSIHISYNKRQSIQMIIAGKSFFEFVKDYI